MKVPLLDLKAQNEPIAGELHDAFTRVLNSGQYILGREVEQLEQQVAALAGARHGIGVSSGTDAILLALMALGVGPGDEVICPSFTFFATAGCIARTGARPVFADSCPVCFNVAPAEIERKLTARTKAIMPVHLFGQTAAMDPISALVRERGIPVIEDAAQALSAAYQGRGSGSMGTFGTYSFFPSKNLGGFGDSGMLVTSDDDLAARAKMLRTHGAKPKYFHKLVGGNFRIDPLQAALIGVKFPKIADYSERRAGHAAYYTEQLSKLPSVGVACLRHSACQGHPAAAQTDLPPRAGVVLPIAYEGNTHIWNQYTLRVVAGPDWNGSGNPRDALQKHLAAREIGSEIYYPRPMHLQECFAAFQPDSPGALPVSERLSRECLSIPVYPELKREQQDAVIAAIEEFLAS